jgi:hypothetical protein
MQFLQKIFLLYKKLYVNQCKYSFIQETLAMTDIICDNCIQGANRLDSA